MAIQVLPRNQVADDIAQNFSTSLARPLQMLAEHKMNQIHQRHQHRQTAQNLQLLGLTPEQAHGIAGLPESVQKQVIGEHFKQEGLRAPGELSKKEQELAHKETFPIAKDILKSASDAKENITRLDRLQELNDRGNLDEGIINAAFNSLGDRFGIDLSGVLNADQQEFKKLSTDFIKNAKSYFGARLTDTDLKTFLQTVPTLYQTDEGRQRVINNMRNLEEAKLVKKDALDHVLRANKGRRPHNLQEQIEKISKPKLDVLAREFKEGSYGKKFSPRLSKETLEHVPSYPKL